MTNTINPADCDRTTVYAGECRNFQDTEWITFNSGRRRSPDARDGNTWLIDVAFGSFWMADDKVRNIVPLVPGRDFSGVDWKAMYVSAAGERDAAFARAEQAEARLSGRCTLSQTVDRDKLAENIEYAVNAKGDIPVAEFTTEVVMQFLGSVEACTTPAVSRADIEKCVYGSRRAGRECDEHGFVPVHVQEAVGQLCDLFGVKAGQAVEPVEAKAIALWRAGYPNSPRTWEEVGQTREAYRRMARYALGGKNGA